ncbi:MAG: hypothetical protein HC888_15710 [Candidatus Competibacteraceae bacterium]|nr:hypothetical protein [Candidatus Competibacteraceae bacterium]
MEYTDPELLQLRGRSPLVLVPIANPANAAALSTLGICFSPTAGRVMMLTIVPPTRTPNDREPIEAMTEVVRRSMNASLESGISRTETLIAVAADPWSEIARVAVTHRCALTLLGMSNLGDEALHDRIESLAAELPGNLAILRAPAGWHPQDVGRVLVPLGGRGVHNALRARLLTALSHRYGRAGFEIRYLIVVPPQTSKKERDRLFNMWTDLRGRRVASGGYR